MARTSARTANDPSSQVLKRRQAQVSARLLLFREKRPPERGAHSEHVEIVGRDPHAMQFLGRGDPREIQFNTVPRRHLLEDAVPISPIDKIGGRHLADSTSRRPLPDHHQSIRLAIRQRLQDGGIDDAEDRGSRANPERESQDGNQREPRCLHQPARAVAQVLPHLFQQTDPALVTARLFSPFDSAKAPERGQARLLRAHSAREVPLDLSLQMELHLCFQFPFHPGSEAERP
ncbi:MAG TPA: hypothetical protein VJ302_11700 [Blastocatellia bacterium]|nr:hypothetical protein [Blastocatellia bacterium]